MCGKGYSGLLVRRIPEQELEYRSPAAPAVDKRLVALVGDKLPVEVAELAVYIPAAVQVPDVLLAGRPVVAQLWHVGQPLVVA